MRPTRRGRRPHPPLFAVSQQSPFDDVSDYVTTIAPAVVPPLEHTMTSIENGPIPEGILTPPDLSGPVARVIPSATPSASIGRPRHASRLRAPIRDVLVKA